MLKRLLNECRLEVELELTGRLMVKEPQEETETRTKAQNAKVKVAQPVATRLPNGEQTLYLPGASLKGALRAQAERIARTLNRHNAGACDPFITFKRNDTPPAADVACSERIAVRQRQHQRSQRQNPPVDELTIPQQFGDVCPICRTFGHIGWGKRLRITDFYPDTAAPNVLEMTHIGIDRVSGGVSTEYLGHNKYGTGRTFTVQYAYRGRLRGTIILENYELWQLGLLGMLWRDMADGLIPVGHKQTGGAGKLKPQLLTMQLTQFGLSEPSASELCGVGALFDQPLIYGYDTNSDRVTREGLSWSQSGIAWQTMLDQSAANSLWRALTGKTATVLANHQWTPAMEVGRVKALISSEVSNDK